MQAKLGQAGELLLHGELHVMSGNAFVISRRLVVDQRALGEVGGGDHDAAGTLAVRRAGDVVSCGGSLKGGMASTVTGDLGSRVKSCGSFGSICAM